MIRCSERRWTGGKAIGWSLREHAGTDPEAVRDFVDRARDRLSPLSAREALGNIG
ncbi:DNA alkylation repair protein [[Kitasatospora] papulosa]|uniref:DNA alkylation repair protein n=1 Tax=[Kitasatospora] papulosa TaxID=1464011 RepID=UPI0036A51067